jgi:hypothetical protein
MSASLELPANAPGKLCPSTEKVMPADVRQAYRRIVIGASSISAALLLATALVHMAYREGTATLPGFALYDVDSEANVPTWYAATLLQICSILAFIISFHDAPEQKPGWRGISLILLLMDMDEVAGLHNMPSRRLSEIIGHGNGYLMNAWVIPAGVILAILGLIYLPFIWRLPRWLKRSLIMAAVAYLIGAVAFEVLGSRFEYKAGGLEYDATKHYSFQFAMTTVAEEAYEHIGVLATMAIFLRHAFMLNSRFVVDFAQLRFVGGRSRA